MAPEQLAVVDEGRHAENTLAHRLLRRRAQALLDLRRRDARVELAPVQAAFFDHYATQCGFCASGFMLAAHSLLEREPGAGRDAIVEGLAGHMCRCTGYVKIVEAVEAAARGEVDTSRDREAEALTEGSQA